VIMAGNVPAMVRSAVPPWRQVADDLRRRIEAGEFPAGSMLPSLTSLAEQYQVSRTTARKAVGALRDAGLVETVRGWGMFVRRE
jgi:GntR family transcriptional regulator